jgi:hypothetical protein
MTYENTASTMILTRNCLALATSEATIPVGFLKSQVTYCNGNSAIIDLLTGVVTFNSLYRKQPGHNKRNDNPTSYVYTPVYFNDPNNIESNEALYRQGRVHILNSLLSDYHRDLFDAALQRAAIQADCDLDEAEVHIHHVNRNRHDNSLCNLLSCTRPEHNKIHNALRAGKSTYEALIFGLGEALVHSIFGAEYFNYGDSSVYTSRIHGVPYIPHILTQLSNAQLPADTTELKVRCLNGKYDNIDIAGLNIYQVLSELYTARAVKIINPFAVNVAI